MDKLKEILLILGSTRERSNSAIEERLKEHEKLYVQSQYFMGTASPTQRNLSPVNQKAIKVIKKPSFKKEVKIHGVNKGIELYVETISFFGLVLTKFQVIKANPREIVEIHRRLLEN